MSQQMKWHTSSVRENTAVRHHFVHYKHLISKIFKLFVLKVYFLYYVMHLGKRAVSFFNHREHHIQKACFILQKDLLNCNI